MTRGVVTEAEFAALGLGSVAAKPKATKRPAGKRTGPRRRPEQVTSLLLHITATGLPAPVEELRFHPRRLWRFDLAWPDRKLACEVDGAVWSGGRHTRGAGFTEDCNKFNEALLLGWRVLRVTSDHVRTGEAVTWIKAALRGAA